MNQKLTAEQIAAYIADPYHCPYCGSDNIEGEVALFDDAITQDISCLSCGRRWRDVLKPAEVQEIA